MALGDYIVTQYWYLSHVICGMYYGSEVVSAFCVQSSVDLLIYRIYAKARCDTSRHT